MSEFITQAWNAGLVGFGRSTWNRGVGGVGQSCWDSSALLLRPSLFLLAALSVSSQAFCSRCIFWDAPRVCPLQVMSAFHCLCPWHQSDIQAWHWSVFAAKDYAGVFEVMAS